MLDSGEDPLYVARRLVRFASEDVGNADPQALILTLAAKDAYDFLGSPEGELALAQATLYLALAPKSNAAYVAYNEARADVEAAPAEPVPLHIRNAPTGLMRTWATPGLSVRPRRTGRAGWTRSTCRNRYAAATTTIPPTAAGGRVARRLKRGAGGAPSSAARPRARWHPLWSLSLGGVYETRPHRRRRPVARRARPAPRRPRTVRGQSRVGRVPVREPFVVVRVTTALYYADVSSAQRMNAGAISGASPSSRRGHPAA